MRRGATIWACVLAGLLTSAAVAQDEKKPDEKAPAAEPVPASFRAYIVSDERFDPKNVRNRTAKMHDLVTDNGLNPVVAVFARTVPAGEDAPLAKLVKQLNAYVQKYRASRAAAFVQFLTLEKEYPEDETRAEKSAAVKALAEQLKATLVPFALAAGKSPTTEAWKIGEGDDLTVIVYHRMKLVKKWGFSADKPPTEDDIKEILAVAEKEAKVGGK
jgi:hypothetical protein